MLPKSNGSDKHLRRQSNSPSVQKLRKRIVQLLRRLSASAKRLLVCFRLSSRVEEQQLDVNNLPVNYIHWIVIGTHINMFTIPIFIVLLCARVHHGGHGFVIFSCNSDQRADEFRVCATLGEGCQKKQAEVANNWAGLG